MKQRWKFVLFIFAVLIGAGSLMFTDRLVKQLAREEEKKVQLWAEATRKLADPTREIQDYGFLLQVLENNTSIPVIWVDSEMNLKGFRNIDSTRIMDDLAYRRILERMKEENPPIEIYIGPEDRDYIYYRNTILLRKLTYYPYVQLGVILLFIAVSYFAFSYSRKVEQNQVWLGLTKETAHQLGTPTSSLIAWLELLKERDADPEIVQELAKDVNRLETITERFSKIGSRPVLKRENMADVLNETVDYLKSRLSDQVVFNLDVQDPDTRVPLNRSLFEWVIENLCKNSVDAMEGKGQIDLKVTDNTQVLYVDLSDTGKGIPKSRYKTIFKPGYTTKKRGWGLGLSLSNRIIEDYHDGKIFVHASEQGAGTTMRIVLKK